MIKLTDIFLPREEIAGLELNDSGAHLILFSTQSKLVSKSGVIFPSGLIEGGEVKDRLKLIKALEILKAQAGPKKLKENSYVIVSVPARNVYSQILELPMLSPQQTEEAIKWNAQMTLPLESAQTYYDWEEVKTAAVQAIKKEVFVALAAKTKIDPYLDVLEEAGFVPLALEMPALGLARLVRFFGTDINITLSYLLIAIDWSGVELMVVKDGVVRFDYYRPWSSKEKENFLRGEMTPSDLVETMVLDVQKVSNFYQARSHESIAGIILISSLDQKSEIEKFLKLKTGLEVFDFRLKYFSDLDDAWFPALGSALRALVPREEDTIVSLMPVGTEEHYQRQKFLAFVSFWGNIVGTVFLGLAALFLVMSVFIGQTENRFFRQLINRPANLTEAQDLETKAREFNNLVAGILNADNASRLSREWDHVFFHLFRAATQSDATIQRLVVSSLTAPVLVSASAPTRDAALDFKKKLEEFPFFYEVELPPSGFTQGVVVSFTVSFSINLARLAEQAQ